MLGHLLGNMNITEKAYTWADFTIDRYNRGEMSKEEFEKVMEGIRIFNEMTKEIEQSPI